MTDRRPHEPRFPGPPGGEMPPIENDQVYIGALIALKGIEDGIAMIGTSDTRRGLQRWANAMRRRIDEYEAEHGRPPQP